MMKPWRSIAYAGMLVIAALAGPDCGQARGRDYSRFAPLAVYKNARFGYSLTYPSARFKPEPESAKGDGRKFYSHDRRAKIATFGAYNVDNYTMEQYRDKIIHDFDGYEQVTYSPRGKTWFVLSGYHNGNVYYQKVMFSCDNEIINVLAVKWPVANREKYDPIIELLEKNFHPGTGANAPGSCRK
jgi:hypothetical protein